MNRKPPNDPYAPLARAYADRIHVPKFDTQAIARRFPRPRAVELPWWRRYALATIAAIALIAWAAPAVPALIADVQSAMQLFLQRNGELVPATDREVTIDQAMKDLPFRVIPPAGVAVATPPLIREISIPGDPGSVELLVQYASNLPGPKPGFTAMPALTIFETAASSAPANLAVTVHVTNQSGMPPLPRGPKPIEGVRIHALTEIWIAGGTRITLVGTPGQITQAQLQAIRRAMGG